MIDLSLIYDLEPTQIPVTVGGQKYILVEASGAAAKAYRRASMKGVEMENDNEGNRTIKKLEAMVEVESLLVSLCLYTAPSDGSIGVLVSQQIIEAWPARVQKGLFEKVKEISDLEEKDDLPELKKQLVRLQTRIAKLEDREDALKNSQGAMVVGSA